MSLGQTLEEQARRIAAMEKAHVEQLAKAYRGTILIGAACLTIGLIVGALWL